ncbi:DUF6392 family protein [Pectobacterium brasiliense]|uniref:DUF6392 family protein n=1 Tax=Pectobacterium brasiliense TaxID=180957 RepID=UPI001F19DEF3|nr:DUF6392 family protein [Pectobacterium brasiliense]
MHDSGLLPYKKPPSATSGDPNLSLVMAKEGVHLSFKRDDLTFQEMTLRIQYKKIKIWIFPNEFPLQKNMSHQWIHENIGEPENSITPKVIMKQEICWIEKLSIIGIHIPITMQIRYDMHEMAGTVTYPPTSARRW